MLITGRQAAEVLARAGLSRRHARRVLDTGLAGQPIRTSSALRYDPDAVEKLAAWPTLAPGRLERLCPTGIFVARRDICVTAQYTEQVAAVSRGWPFTIWSGAVLGMDLHTVGPMPLVATVASFVEFGAELVDLAPGADGVRLVLERPGPWFDELDRHRVVTGRGGRPWAILGGEAY